MTRKDYVLAIRDTLGPNLFEVVELRDGWPSLCKIRVGNEWRSIALHAGLIGLSHRGRDDVERRFQNPGQNKPVVSPPGYTPLLVGLYYENKRHLAVLVGMDAISRIGEMTRKSLFVPVGTLNAASKLGWSSYTSASGEVIHAFIPEMFPVFASINDPGKVMLPEITGVLESVGYQDDPGDPQAIERGRVAS